MAENLMSAKDGMIILEEVWLKKNVKATGEGASAHWEWANKLPDGPKKSLRRKDICLNRFLMQMKVSYSGKKNDTKDVY